MSEVVANGQKRRVIKKKVVKPETVVATPVSTTTVESTDAESSMDSSVIIPSSRIKNYINREKLNKNIDGVIHKIKDDSNIDLNSVLSDEIQKKVGSIIKKKEEKKENDIDIKSIALDILSKQRFKFSHSSFKVLSVFSDLMIEEITKFSMAELLKNKKSIINTKYIFNDEIKQGKLYNIYSNLPTFKTTMSMLTATDDDESTPVVETETETETDDKKSINFEFYIKRICNKIKTENEEFSNVKVSEKYQKFCSGIVLDFLDRVAPLSKIMLEVMTTKTITDTVFMTVIKSQIWDLESYDSIMEEMEKRLK